MINSWKDFFYQTPKLPVLDDDAKKAQKENDKKFKNRLNEKCEEFVVKQETGEADETSEDEEETPEDDLPMNDIKVEAVDEDELLEQTQHDIEDIQSDYQSDEGEPEGEGGDEETEPPTEDGEEIAENGEETAEGEGHEEPTESDGEAMEDKNEVNEKPASKEISSVDLTEDDEVDEDKKLLAENQKLLDESLAEEKSSVQDSKTTTKVRHGSEEKENLQNQQPVKMPDSNGVIKSSSSLDSYMERLSVIVNELYKGLGLPKNIFHDYCELTVRYHQETSSKTFQSGILQYGLSKFSKNAKNLGCRSFRSQQIHNVL